jgi:hypothetical protein
VPVEPGIHRELNPPNRELAPMMFKRKKNRPISPAQQNRIKIDPNTQTTAPQNFALS